MKNIKLSLLALGLVSGLLFSCGNDDDTPTPAKKDISYASIADFYKSNGVKGVVKTIDATKGGFFTGTNGSKVTIPALAFVNSLGAVVTGNVSITFKDIYKKSDMILSNMPTNTIYGLPLVSGGEFYFEAKQGTEVLSLDAGKTIQVEMPSTKQADPQMDPYVFVPNAVGTFTTGWTEDILDSVTVKTAFSYLFSLSGVINPGNWYNCDHPYTAAPYTSITVKQTDNVNDYTTNVFIVVKDDNAVINLYSTGSNEFPYYYAPEGKAASIVAIGVKNKKLYYAIKDIIVSSGLSETFTLAETTTDALKVKLEKLN